VRESAVAVGNPAFPGPLETRVFEFRVLGGTDLVSREDGRRVRSILAQPKRLAVLTFLTVADPGGLQRRDTLLGIFWPDLPEDRARSALRSTLYQLRRSLEAGVIRGRGDEEVGIDPDRLQCDAVEFRRALDSGELKDALSLYGGDLLPGFHLSGVAEFEKWLSREQSSLRKQAADAAIRLARSAPEEAPDEGVRWARRALSIDSLDESAARLLISWLSEAGDRAGAIQAYHDFEGRLASELDVEPSTETRALAARVRGGSEGADLEAPEAGEPNSVPESSEPAGDEEVPTPGSASRESGESASTGWFARRRPGLLWAFLGLLLAAGTAVLLEHKATDARAPLATPNGPTRILVADFQSLGNDTILADALSEGVRITLARSPGIRVAGGRTVSDALHRMRRPADQRLTEEIAREVAIREGIDAVVTGQVREAGSAYVIMVSLLDPTSGEVLDGWLQTAGNSSDLPSVIEGIWSELRASLESVVAEAGAEGSRGLVAVTTPSLTALRTYVQADRAYYAGHVLRAASLYEEAVGIDTAFAAAHVRLAIALGVARHSRGRELEALSRAYRLRDQLPELEQYVVAARYLRYTGRLYRAMEAYRRVVLAGETKARTGVALCLIQLQDLDAAEKMLRQARRDGEFSNDELLVRVVHAKGRSPEARRIYRESMERAPQNPVFMELGVELAAAAGDYERADSLASEIGPAQTVGIGARHPLRHRAHIHAIRGQYSAALDFLEKQRTLQSEANAWEPMAETILLAARFDIARGDTTGAVRRIDRLLEQMPLDSIHPLGRPYIQLPVADLLLDAGRPDRARGLLDAYDRTVQPEFSLPGRGRRLLVESKLRAAEGDTPAAMAALEAARSEKEVRGMLDFDLPIFVPAGDRPDVARLYRRAGRPDSAIAVYERYLSNTALLRRELDGYELAATLERVAALYDSVGRPRDAARAYRELVRLWDNPDPVLTDRLRKARRKARIAFRDPD